MIFHQFYLNCLAHASYLVGDEQTGVAAVVDPQRDVDQYLALAQARGLRIAHVFLTHLHADFIAGHLELRDRAGATIYLGAAANAEYAFTPLADGDRVEFGRVRLQAIETPGHTPESISIAVVSLSLHNVTQSSNDRKRLQAINTAEAGIGTTESLPVPTGYEVIPT